MLTDSLKREKKNATGIREIKHKNQKRIYIMKNRTEKKTLALGSN